MSSNILSSLPSDKKYIDDRKIYNCDKCQKYFTRPSALQTHMYTHTGEKPHVCDMPGCGRRFAVVSNLRRHLRVHKPSHIRRQLTAQERRVCVEKLIQKTGGVNENFSTQLDSSYVSPYYIISPYSYSASSDSSCSSGSPSPTLSPVMENTTYRSIKPKEARPLRLTVKYLLTNNAPSLPPTHRVLNPKPRPACLSVKSLLN
ncbi:uncharacterized protein B0P05DRAFT_548232 [Gilbertella persicaria]|uniref:uncharacterized protein n=1 Tax=Gilbertella persicaria TaxID=101096 RepID=UPI0022208018|nr:uncharacterized protein B0P05DRAFT_548232 [Gilbertella persicaria]KAI8074357.1 hypothetical protein B0P05DRAFT_548232 [Gilbertella persicaria]